jgi:thioesterase domain-containing protein
MTMTKTEARDYLYQHIPLSRAMGIDVTEVSCERVALSIPLEPNINHQLTAFGGSISAAAMLSCWMLAYLRLNQSPNPTRLVIHKNRIVYRRPISEAFEAICTFSDDEAWQEVLDMLDNFGKTKIQLNASICCAGQEAAAFWGSFVVVSD